MKRTLALATALALAVAACGDDGPTGPGGSDGEMEATVGGVSFDASAATATRVDVQGLVTLGGTQTSGGLTTVITMNVLNAEEGETFNFDPNVAGTFAQVAISDGTTQGTEAWITTLSPGTGTITFNTLNDDRAEGTFQFTGQASPGTPATGQKVVTSGTFNIEF